jgi:pyrimidine 5'-nucleotidase
LWHRATYIIVRHETNGHDDNHHHGDDDNTYLLVQRRSNIKDYCPGKLDPTPGGVVGHNEAYDENAIREIEEEMNIRVEQIAPNGNSDPTVPSSKNTNANTLQPLFTFPYQDDKVNVWGKLYELVYKGSLSDIIIQPEEVSEIKRLSLSQIHDMIHSNPTDWMPDSLHALKLYLQRKSDMKVKRRLLKEYSSGDLDSYTLRPKPKVIFFDCDDCLYFDNWTVANQLTAKIEHWCTTKKQLPPGKAYELYKTHGTALRGLLAEGLMEDEEEIIDEYLKDVHDVPIHHHLSKDEELREMILRIDPTIPKFIFTASVRHHAERCLVALGIDDLFIDIIDVKTCNLATKHSREAFEAAMARAGVTEPECCLFLDDSTKNIAAARTVGWRSILVGTTGRDCGKVISSDHAEHEIEKIHDMPKILPELFQS